MPAAANNQEVHKAVCDAMSDANYALLYVGKHDYYGKTDLVKAKLEAAWAALYDARQIIAGNHREPR